MKNEKDLCILSVKYSLINCSDEQKESLEKTEFEHVFVAHTKKEVLQKIKSFEAGLQDKSTTEPSGFPQRLQQNVMHFVDNFRASYNQLLRL